MNFIFEQIRIGGDRNFGYLIGDRESKEGVLIDPAYSPESVVERAKAQHLKVTHIINTHGHHDHTNGNTKAKELTGAPLAAFHEAASNPEVPLKDNGTLFVGALTLRFLHTPGHYPDHLVIVVEGQDVALTGDLIFVGKIGGTGNDQDAKEEWHSLQRVIQDLPDTTTLWPGHDYGCRPATTMGLEKRNNPFMSCKNIEEFFADKARLARVQSKEWVEVGDQPLAVIYRLVKSYYSRKLVRSLSK